jgi:hypothetical protein
MRKLALLLIVMLAAAAPAFAFAAKKHHHRPVAAEPADPNADTIHLFQNFFK